MSSRFDQTLAELRRAVEDPAAPGARARITRALAGKNGMLVAVATGAAVSPDEDDPRVDRALLESLPAAFERLLHDPVKRDPQCRGKVAIVQALRRAEVCPEEVFLAGVRHVQPEPVWGGRVDSAGELRGVCGMALMEEHHPRALVELAHLLADPLVAARRAAARALGNGGRADVAEPLLRLRIEAGEDEPDVLDECFGALLQVAPEASLDYVAGFLGSRDDAVAEAAALALGASRLEGARSRLCALAERSVKPERRRVAMLAVAMLRSEAAWGWLLEAVEREPPGVAQAALAALAAFEHDPKLRARASEAVAMRSDGALQAAFEELFP